jgi:hypothetical protein
MELGISDKTLRGFLRRRFPRHAGEHGSAWSVTIEQADTARTHFGEAARTATTQSAMASRTQRKTSQSIPITTMKLNEQRQQAAERFKPNHIRLLLVAETPPVHRPPDPPRYFYFDSVSKHDDLFRGVVRAVLRAEPDRANKSALLSQLREQGVFLIDLKIDPTDPRPFSACVDDLVERCRQLRPDHIVLIKSNVYDEAFAAIRSTELPVVDVRIPFPGSGRQTEFANEMARALRLAGWALR